MRRRPGLLGTVTLVATATAALWAASVTVLDPAHLARVAQDTLADPAGQGAAVDVLAGALNGPGELDPAALALAADLLSDPGVTSSLADIAATGDSGALISGPVATVIDQVPLLNLSVARLYGHGAPRGGWGMLWVLTNADRIIPVGAGATAVGIALVLLGGGRRTKVRALAGTAALIAAVPLGALAGVTVAAGQHPSPGWALAGAATPALLAPVTGWAWALLAVALAAGAATMVRRPAPRWEPAVEVGFVVPPSPHFEEGGEPGLPSVTPKANGRSTSSR